MPGPLEEPMPESIEPMKATTVDSLPPREQDWAFEIKWDGFRMIAFVADGAVRLQSRRLLDNTADFPQVQGLAEQLAGHRAVLDGEVCALDERGRPRFGLLQQRGT